MLTTIKIFFKNTYTQTIFALLITGTLVVLLGRILFQPNLKSNIQFASMIGIAITVFLFFSFSLWKVNQQNRWISKWSNHPYLVMLTFAIFPVILTFLWNTPVINSALPKELVFHKGNLYFPHFMFFYFWEALIFGIAFLAHPKRKEIKWHFSVNQFVLSLLLSLGTWSVIMFLNEIQLQWTSIPVNYMGNSAFFWPVIPLALLIVPVSVSYFFFYPQSKSKPLKLLFYLILFALIPLRTICILPALFVGITLSISSRKNFSFFTIAFTYVLINLFTLLMNWQWII